MANVKLASSVTLGSFLTDSVGNTLYFFALDVAGTNSCTSAACNPTWPVCYSGRITPPSGLNASGFTSKKTADGRNQNFYEGWPLYYYAPATNGTNTREAAGQTSGNGISGVWYVLYPSYSVVLARKSVVDQPTNVASTKTYLVDAQGRPLYYFAKNDASPNTKPTNCTGGCLSAWPALLLSAPIVPSGLNISTFSTMARTETNTSGSYGSTTSSTQQLTYKGRPQYYFTNDNANQGQVTGDHLASFGDFWFVAAP